MIVQYMNKKFSKLAYVLHCDTNNYSNSLSNMVLRLGFSSIQSLSKRLMKAPIGSSLQYSLKRRYWLGVSLIDSITVFFSRFLWRLNIKIIFYIT